MQAPRARIIGFGRFRLDLGRNQLFSGDEPLAVPPKAVEVLRVLVERHGTLVSKDELMRIVWPDAAVEEANLAQQVFTLRRLLGDDPDRPTFIATALALETHAAVIRLDTLSTADGVPVSLAVHYFDSDRFAGIGKKLAAYHSITRALVAFGVDDYVRVSTEVTARMASVEEADRLALTSNPILLETVAINADSEGRPIQYSRTLFAADRIALRLDTPGK